MKKLILIVVVILSSTAYSQTPETAIKSVMQLQAEAWNKGDVDGFMKHYWNNPELTFVSKNGVSKGWQQVYDNYKRGYPDKEAMGNLTFDNLVIQQLNGKTCMVTGSWFLDYVPSTDTDRQDVGGWFTLVFKKIKKDWVIIYDHTS